MVETERLILRPFCTVLSVPVREAGYALGGPVSGIRVIRFSTAFSFCIKVTPIRLFICLPFRLKLVFCNGHFKGIMK